MLNIIKQEIEMEKGLKQKLEFICDIVEYDSVVNQFFLPMMKQKIENPIKELEKELKQQKDKLDRIKQAYVNGVFSLEEYDNDKNVLTKILVI